MNRSLKVLTAVIVLVGLLTGTALAKSAPTKFARLDPSYGRNGSYAVATNESDVGTERTRLALAADGEAYVLQGRTILAFSPDGQPDHSFGKNGRVWVEPGPGEVTKVSGIAVDPAGDVLVAGTYVPFPGFINPVVKGSPEFPTREGVTEAFVARYLPDGSNDPAFGSGGAVITSFGLPRPTNRPSGGKQPEAEYERPSLTVTHLAVDSQGRPVVSGEYVESMEWCGYGSSFPRSFVARLNSNGALETSFGGTGYAKLPGGASGSIGIGPGDEIAAFSTNTHPCVEHFPGPDPYWFMSVLAEGGGSSPTLDPARPLVAVNRYTELAVDPQGRILFTEWQGLGPFGEGEGSLKVVRLLANGDLDTGFGHEGAATLNRFEMVGAQIAVDGRGRTVVSFGSTEPKLIRISASGTVEAGFAKKTVFHAKIERVDSTSPEAVAIDSKGRIVVAGTAKGGVLKTGFGVGIARVLPSR